MHAAGKRYPAPSSLATSTIYRGEKERGPMCGILPWSFATKGVGRVGQQQSDGCIAHGSVAESIEVDTRKVCARILSLKAPVKRAVNNGQPSPNPKHGRIEGGQSVVDDEDWYRVQDSGGEAQGPESTVNIQDPNNAVSERWFPGPMRKYNKHESGGRNTKTGMGLPRCNIKK